MQTVRFGLNWTDSAIDHTISYNNILFSNIDSTIFAMDFEIHD